MNLCHVCGSERYRYELVDEAFVVDGAITFVKQIPARVCENCGDVIFSRETTEKVRRIIHGESKPISRVEVPVYEYA